MKLSFVLSGLLSAACFVGTSNYAKADVLLDTFTSTQFGGYLLENDNGGHQSLGVLFSSAQPATITGLSLAIFGVGQFQIGLMAGAPGPSTELIPALVPDGTWIDSTTVATDDYFDAYSDITVSGLNWTITGNESYWLTAVATSSFTNGGWATGTEYGPVAFTTFDGQWSLDNEPDENIVEAKITTAAVPEPPSLFMLLTGLGLIGGCLGGRRALRRGCTI